MTVEIVRYIYTLQITKWQAGGPDFFALSMRVGQLMHNHSSKNYQRQKSKLQIDLELFLGHMNKDLGSCSPRDICLYLVWKDSQGKTAIHAPSCLAIGDRKPQCNCPRRLAYGTVAVKISQLKSIFSTQGMPNQWNHISNYGNPVISSEVNIYLHQIKMEQSKGHSTPRQAIPIFANKLRVVGMYIDRQLEKDSKPEKCFILARDHALFTLMFFGGDRAHDVGQMLTQEIKILPDSSGYVIHHTWGKTCRLNKPNIFTIFRCQEKMICPVTALETYINIAKRFSVDLSKGYLFRPLSPSGRVLAQPLQYEAIYERLKFYLDTLAINEGETPHSLRGGCAITFQSKDAQSQSGRNVGAVMQQVGWASEWSAHYYTRSKQMDKTMGVALSMAQDATLTGTGFTDVTQLGKAFP